MKPLTTIRYEEHGNVARVWLERTHTNMRMVRDLTAVCDHLEDDSDCDFVVFRGADGVFSHGIDFADFRPDQPMDIHGFGKWEKLCVRIERLPKATIAALEGAVIGGGFQLALACDARLCTPEAVLRLDEIHHGFLPGMATFRLAKYIGLGHAKRIIMQCAEVGAAEAQRLGIIDEICPDIEAGIAAAIDRFSPVHPVAVSLARRLLNESFATSFENAIGNFLAAQHRAITQTAFLETLKRTSVDDG